MLKLNIKKSKQYIKELYSYNKQKWDSTIYSIDYKKLKFKGAQLLLDKAIKLCKPINVYYRESQPCVYEPEDKGFASEYYWTYTGEITFVLHNTLNRKTHYNLKTISATLNKVYGYRLILDYKNTKIML